MAPQVEINPLVKGDGVAIAPCLPIASYARLHQEPLALVVAVVSSFRRKRRSMAHDAHPFCQDENPYVRVSGRKSLLPAVFRITKGNTDSVLRYGITPTALRILKIPSRDFGLWAAH